MGKFAGTFRYIAVGFRERRVKAMDEKPVKPDPPPTARCRPASAGRSDEVCFPFHASRPIANTVLVTDPYAAYEQYEEKAGIGPGRCWSHSHRAFFEALTAEPTDAEEALEQTKTLYASCTPSKRRSVIAN
jgi:hypothetical protein